MRLLAEYNLKPSDALHVAAMRTNGIELVISEDRKLDRVPRMKRAWLPDTP